MGAQCQAQKTQNCCGYGRNNQLGTAMIRHYPERAEINRNRRWNHKAKNSEYNESLLSDHQNLLFEDEKVNQCEQDMIVIDPELFSKFNTRTRDIVFGYFRSAESLLNKVSIKGYVSDDSSFLEDEIMDLVEMTETRIPNNIHYLVLLYYYLMEDEFENESLALWNQRSHLSDFMSTTLKSTRSRIWDKFDRYSKQMLSTEKYLPKFVYTISVLYMKTKRRKSVPPKYTKVKVC